MGCAPLLDNRHKHCTPAVLDFPSTRRCFDTGQRLKNNALRNRFSNNPECTEAFCIVEFLSHDLGIILTLGSIICNSFCIRLLRIPISFYINLRRNIP